MIKPILVLAIMMSWPYKMITVPCGERSASECLEVAVIRLRQRDMNYGHPYHYKIHAISLQQKDWDTHSLAWDSITNRLVTQKDFTQTAKVNFMAIEDPPSQNGTWHQVVTKP